MGIIKNYHDKKWTLQFLDALYNSIDIDNNLTQKIIMIFLWEKMKIKLAKLKF
jgi:hypothetical protein